VSNDDPVLGLKRTWTKADWEEYRCLSWINRRLTDLVILVPRLTSWVGPLMIHYDERRQRRNYEKARRTRARQETVAKSHRMPGPRARSRKK
jgi:hypothetical protein